MNNSKGLIELARTNQLISNLDLTIEVANLLNNIIKFSDDIRRLESSGDSSMQIQVLKHKVSKLEIQIEEARDKLRP